MNEGAGSIAADAGANGADLFMTSPVWVGDGHAGGALRFNGQTGAVASASALHFTDLTVALWVRGDPSHPPIDGAAIVELGGRAACGHATWGLYVDGESFKFGWQDGAAGQFFATDGFVVDGHHLWDGAWHSIAVALSAQPWSYLYQRIDGYGAGGTQMSPDLDYSGVVLDTLSVAQIAGNCNVPPRFRGDVDELRLYDKQLTSDEIGGLMPPIPTTATLTGPTTRLAQEVGCYSMETVPGAGGGTADISLVPSLGDPIVLSMLGQENGHYGICVSLAPGAYSVSAAFSNGRPWTPATSNTIHLVVSKRSSSGSVSGRSRQLSSGALLVGGFVDGRGVMVTGSVAFYEIVNGRRVSRGTVPLDYTGTNFVSLATLTLPARAAGSYAFEFDYAGDTNHLGSTGSGSIVVTQDVVPGAVTIDDGALTTRDPIVKVDAPATAATGLVISNSGTAYKAFYPYQPTVSDWSLTDPQYGGTGGDGLKTIHVRWYNAFSEETGDAHASILLDTVAPTSTAPTWKLGVKGSALVSGAIPVSLAWTGSDATSGIARYNLSQQVDGGTWTSLSATLTSTALTRNLAPGHTYRFALRAIDMAGNVGAWVYGAPFTLKALQQSNLAIRYHGTWTTSLSTTWWGGGATSSSSAGATASLTFTGRSFAWISLTAYNRGKAQVYVNGVLIRTVDLYSATLQKQRIAWSMTWSTNATRTVLIKVLGTSTRPRIDVDGFITGT